MSFYSQLLQSFLLPLHNAVRGRSQIAHRRLLERSQWWPEEKVREFQWRELGKLLDWAFDSVPYYQRKYKAAGAQRGDISNWESYKKLPPLSRTELNQFRQELCSPQYTGRLIPHATGGSSGVPSRFFITEESYDWRIAATWRAYSWSGVAQGQRSLYLWGAPVGTPPAWKRFKSKAYYWFQNQLVFNTMSQTEELWHQVYEAALRNRPLLIVGYVSSLEEFSRYLKSHDLRLPGIVAVIAAAEPVFASTRDLVESAIKAPLFNTYGSREFMSLAAECEYHDGLHINSENILLETELDLDAGPSEILITDLHNFGMPFLRYKIGDAGALLEGPCPCGRGLPRIRSIEGRTMDLLRTADGRVVPGEFFPHVMKDLREVSEFQVEQSALNEVVISVVLAEPLSDASRHLLAGEVKRVFGAATQVTVRPVDGIVKRSSGKRRVTVGLADHG